MPTVVMHPFVMATKLAAEAISHTSEQHGHREHQRTRDQDQ